jgi:hypothetical protein
MLGILSIQLAHDRIALDCSSRAFNKICFGLTLGDVKPPEGVDIICLEEVCIFLNISTLTLHPIGIEALGSSPDSILGECLFRDPFQSKSKEASQRLPCHSALRIASYHDQASCRYEKGTDISEILLVLLDEDIHDEDMMLLDTDNSHTISTNGSEHGDDDTVKEAVGNQTLLDPLTSLMNTTLGLNIHDDIKIQPGVDVIECNIPRRLCEVVPALWSPGYLSVRSSGDSGRSSK